MNIVGPGPSLLTVADGGFSGIFTVSPGARVAISGLTITGGFSGAKIDNLGARTIANDVIGGNSGGSGGIDNSGMLSITDSTISHVLLNSRRPSLAQAAGSTTPAHCRSLIPRLVTIWPYLGSPLLANFLVTVAGSSIPARCWLPTPHSPATLHPSGEESRIPGP